MASLYAALLFPTDIVFLKGILTKLETINEDTVLEQTPYWPSRDAINNSFARINKAIGGRGSLVDPFQPGLTVLRARIMIETIIHEGELWVASHKPELPSWVIYGAVGVGAYALLKITKIIK